MNTTIRPAQEIKMEVLPPEVASASTELSCPSNKALELFQPFRKPFEAAAALLKEEESATTATDARALRLKMVKARTTISNTTDAAKSDIKLSSNIIDWYHNKGRDRLAEAESRLMEIEKAEERREAARIESIRKERAEILDEMEHNYQGMNLGPMTEDHWQVYLQQAKDIAELRKQREARVEAERIAEAKRQEEEREAQRLENIRLREEADKAAAELAKQKAEQANNSLKAFMASAPKAPQSLREGFSNASNL